MSLFLDVAYLLALGAASPYLAYRVISRPRHLDGLRARLGACPPRAGEGPCVWVHGVSVGEVVAAQPLIEELTSELGRDGKAPEIVVSTTTSSGQEVAKRRFPGRQVVYYPIDFSWSVRRVLDAVRPSLILLVELELWPNFLKEAHRRGIPVIVVNGRISEKSFRGYRLARGVIPFDKVARYCVQTEDYGRRFAKLGVSPEKIVVTGSMKYDGIRTGGLDGGELRRTLGLAPDDLVWIAGSTHSPEERALVEIHGRLKKRWPKLRLVIAPRHVERSAEVVRELEATGEPVVRRSEQNRAQQGGKAPVPAPSGIILIDTIGELGRLYAAADLVFVGGSLVRHGGQNFLEPAGLGKPVLFGPHTFNFQESVERLLRTQAAIQVQDAAELERELAGLLSDEEKRRAIGLNARSAIEAAKGATARTLAVIQDTFRRGEGAVTRREEPQRDSGGAAHVAALAKATE